MLPHEYRLKRMKDFEILFKEGWFINGNLLTAKVWKINVEKYKKRDYKDGDLKIGFVVGLKVSKKAVERNRLKRQMREVVRLLLKDDKIKNGYMIAFVAKPGMLGADYKIVEKEVLDIFKKGGLLK